MQSQASDGSKGSRGRGEAVKSPPGSREPSRAVRVSLPACAAASSLPGQSRCPPSPPPPSPQPRRPPGTPLKGAMSASSLLEQVSAAEGSSARHAGKGPGLGPGALRGAAKRTGARTRTHAAPSLPPALPPAFTRPSRTPPPAEASSRQAARPRPGSRPRSLAPAPPRLPSRERPPVSHDRFSLSLSLPPAPTLECCRRSRDPKAKAPKVSGGAVTAAAAARTTRWRGCRLVFLSTERATSSARPRRRLLLLRWARFRGSAACARVWLAAWALSSPRTGQEPLF